MYVVGTKEMREIDRVTVEEYGVPETILMENAGISMLAAMQNEYGGMLFRRISVFVKGGNNGGDGIVLARHLKNEGADVAVFFAGDEKSKKTKETTENIERTKKYGVPFEYIKDMRDIEKHKSFIVTSDILVDALIGTGLEKNIEGSLASLIVYLNSLGKRIVSADIPSGVNADTAEVMGVALNASLTVAFGLPKTGTTLYPGLEKTGKLVVSDISFPQELLRAPRKNVLITPEIAVSMLPIRPPNANKGSFGPVFILGGSPGLDGAVTLTGRAALRSGAGIVNAGIPENLYNAVKSRSDEMIVTPLKEAKDGSISADNYPLIMKICEKAAILAIGPGIGRNPETQEMVRKIIQDVQLPVVIDADGINAVSVDKKCLKNKGKDVILTPHIGEMSGLTGKKIEEIIKDKISVSKAFVEETGANVLLKDGRSLVADIQGNIYINSTGNSGMATPGSGDVLTGITASFMAHGITSVQAAIAANYIHGLAGDMILDEVSGEGIIAGDIINFVPRAIKKLRS